MFIAEWVQKRILLVLFCYIKFINDSILLFVNIYYQRTINTNLVRLMIHFVKYNYKCF